MVAIEVYHNDDLKGVTEVEGVQSVGVYGFSGSAQYTVKPEDNRIIVRVVGSFNPDTGNEVELEAKELSATEVKKYEKEHAPVEPEPPAETSEEAVGGKTTTTSTTPKK